VVDIDDEDLVIKTQNTCIATRAGTRCNAGIYSCNSGMPTIDGGEKAALQRL
jgi:hypothetical protein